MELRGRVPSSQAPGGGSLPEGGEQYVGYLSGILSDRMSGVCREYVGSMSVFCRTVCRYCVGSMSVLRRDYVGPYVGYNGLYVGYHGLYVGYGFARVRTRARAVD